MDRTTAVLITLVSYKLILIGIGLYANSKSSSEEDFFLGGRKLGPWVAAMSASASSSSAWTLLGLSGFAYANGLSAIWFFPSCVGGFFLNWFVVAPAIRHHVKGKRVLTVTDVLVQDPEKPGSRWVAVFASILIIVLFTIYVASQFQAAGKAFADSFGMDLNTAVILGASIVLLYTLLGGFWAVSLTDTLQGMMMAFTALLLPLVALFKIGPGELLSALQAVDDPDFWRLIGGRGWASGFGFVVGVFGVGMAYPGQPHVVNRFMALDERELALRQARRIALIWAFVIYAGMILLGWCGRVLFEEMKDGETVLIAAANELLHPVLAGIMIAAVLSAIMSTADSQLLVAASAVVHDLGWVKAKNNAVVYSRFVIAGISLLALGVVFGGDASIFTRVLFAFSAAGAAFGPPLLAICLGREPSSKRVFSAMVAGVVAVLLARFVVARGPWKSQVMLFEYTLPILLSALIVFSGRRSPRD